MSNMTKYTHVVKLFQRVGISFFNYIENKHVSRARFIKSSECLTSRALCTYLYTFFLNFFPFYVLTYCNIYY